LQVVWKAGFFDITGYGTAARGCVLCLDILGVNLRLIPDRKGSPGKIPAETVERIRRLAKRSADSASRTIFVRQSIPDQFVREGFFSMGVTAWETTRVHHLWRDWSNAMDAIGVPSNMNVEAFAGAGVVKPVELLRYGVDHSFLNPGKYKNVFIGKKMPPFKFLSVFDWIYRKGYDLLIRSFWEEFTRKDGVCLVIKTGFGRPQVTPKKILEEMRRLKELLKPCKDFAPIFLLTGEMPPEDMVNLYRSCHCFVLPSRGEGAGLPFLEAGSLGMPVIATGWGGQTDFLSPENSFPVDYSLTPVPAQRHCPYYQPDQLWARPDLYDLRRKMRWVVENRNISLERGRRLRELVLGNYTWERAAQDVVKTLGRLTGEKIV